MDDAQVKEFLARLQASADKARNSQDEAARVARGKPRVMDPGDTGVEDLVPQPTSTEAYDFEKANAETRVLAEKPEMEGHGVATETDVHADPLDAETRILDGAPEKPSATGRLAKARADAQRVLEEVPGPDTTPTLKMKAQSRALPQAEGPSPAKSIEQLAQEDAERILGKKPMTPPKTGELADAPVQEVLDPRGKELASAKPEPTPEAAPEGKILTAAEDAAQLQAATPKTPVTTAAEDLMAGTIKRSVPNSASRLAARAAAVEARGAYVAPSLKTRALEALGTAGESGAGKFAKTFAKGVGSELVAPFTGAYKGFVEGGKGYSEAGALGKMYKGGKAVVGGAWGLGKNATKLAAEAIALPAIIGAEGNIISDKLTYGSDEDYGHPNENPGLVGAREQQVANLQNYNANANKYGLKVSGNTNPLKMLLYGGPQIKVQEDPTLKAAYMARNKARIQAMKDSWASNQPKGHSD